MKKIKLKLKQWTSNKELKILVDDKDFETLNRYSWTPVKKGKTYYAMRKEKNKTIYMHHTIIGCPSKGFETDHKDGNGLNNQRGNLRFVTKRQNAQNKKNIIKTSQYPGVFWNKECQKWLAQIREGNTRKRLGLFISEVAAFSAYRLAVNELGEKMIGE